MYENKKTTATKIKINVQGGVLEIQFEVTDKGYSQIFLSGPADQVYSGTFKF